MLCFQAIFVQALGMLNRDKMQPTIENDELLTGIYK